MVWVQSDFREVIFRCWACFLKSVHKILFRLSLRSKKSFCSAFVNRTCCAISQHLNHENKKIIENIIKPILFCPSEIERRENITSLSRISSRDVFGARHALRRAPTSFSTVSTDTCLMRVFSSQLFCIASKQFSYYSNAAASIG